MPAKKKTRTAPSTLRQWRMYRRLTLERVAEIIGVGPTAIHKWETGKAPVDLETLALLAKAYSTETAALLFSPAEGTIVAQLRDAYRILVGTDPATAQKWLDIGNTLAGGSTPSAPGSIPTLTNGNNKK